ncbi:hypothetical protein [Treponema primitia]|uniref:hypothetical protein n=1 Tax=Treponema primitia TaxID=88058 RepID=UPI000255590D|nr:hypothetical protein [Treponema primitia]
MEKQKKDWEQFFEDGQGFHRTVRGGLKRQNIFTPELIQNIAAMGIEKYFMAIFTHRGILPQNHTMSDFVGESKLFMTLPEDLEKSLLYFDSLQSICSIFDFTIIKPKPEDVPLFVDAIDRVARLAEQEIALPATTFHTQEPTVQNAGTLH